MDEERVRAIADARAGLVSVDTLLMGNVGVSTLSEARLALECITAIVSREITLQEIEITRAGQEVD